MRFTSLILLLATGSLPTLSPAQQKAKSFIYNDDQSLGYLEYLPPGYETGTELYPVLIFLHGGGEGGNGSPGDLEKVKSWGPPRLISEGHDMCFTVGDTEECFIVISPQIVTQIHNWTYFVPYIIDHVLSGPENYRADPDRIYLTGLSRGGFGTYDFAASFLNEPNRLAAIAPISAWTEGNYDGCNIARRKIPVWAFHGRKDSVVPYAQGAAAFSKIEFCSNPVPETELIFTTYEDRYHDAWIPAYDPSHEYHNPNLYEWLLLQTRAPDIVTGTDDEGAAQNVFSIYPNPARSELHLTYEDGHLSHTIAVRDINGVLIGLFFNDPVRVDVSALSPGVYIFQATTPSGNVATKRVIKL